MRSIAMLAILIGFSMPVLAQREPPQRGGRMTPRGPQALAAESAVRQAVEQLGNERKSYDRDLEVLRHLRAADEALIDSMQPLTAVQRAYEEVSAAKVLHPDYPVSQGVVRTLEELENARRSPAAADFGRLRTILRTEAVGPAAKAVVRNGIRLQDETVSWLRVQELIATHLRTLAEVTGESLRAAQ